MRNAKFLEFAETPRPVVAIGNVFPDGHVISPHRHERSQLVYADLGIMTVGTEQGRWVVPPGRAVWIPRGVVHELRMMARVETITIWLDPAVACDLPSSCRVVEVSPFVHHLLHEAIEVMPEYNREGRDGNLMALLLHELKHLSELPLCLPFPQDERLATRCQAFLKEPRSSETIDRWCRDLGMSRRAFTRLFRKETGTSFSVWRQQACLIAALPRLAAGDPVTVIALDLGYESPAAFTTMFKRLQGVPPRQFSRPNTPERRSFADVP
jgi:AraC-like DNA-binding protein